MHAASCAPGFARTLWPLAFACTIALYGMAARADEHATPGPGTVAQCAGATAMLPTLRSLAHGEVAALHIPEASQHLPELAFESPKGEAVTLGQLGGKTRLVNIWATWCAPCRKEMPSLDRLQQQLGGGDFDVVVINTDLRDPSRQVRFLDEIGVKSLTRYADPSARTFQILKQAGRATTLPATVLVDQEGCELAFLSGSLEWDHPETIAFLRAAIGKSSAR
jgi:thiol-disulfide isomerase/thioredoxin